MRLSQCTESCFLERSLKENLRILKPISKEVEDLNDTTDQLILYSTTAERTFFSNRHSTVSRIELKVSYKTGLNKLKKIKIIQTTFSYHNGIKLDINGKEKTGKFINMWKLNNILLNTQ